MESAGHSPRDPDNLKPEEWWPRCQKSLLLKIQPIRRTHRLIMHLRHLPLILVCKNPCLKATGEPGSFWALAAYSPCLTPCKYTVVFFWSLFCFSFFKHNLVPVGCICLPSVQQTRVQFGKLMTGARVFWSHPSQGPKVLSTCAGKMVMQGKKQHFWESWHRSPGHCDSEICGEVLTRAKVRLGRFGDTTVDGIKVNV